jgi:pilus assembly protein TadC
VIGLGAILTASAVALFVVAVRPADLVSRRLELVAPARPAPSRWRGVPQAQLRDAGLAIDPDRFLVVKIAMALTAVVASIATTLLVPVGPAVVALAGYAGFIAPSIVVDGRASRRRAAAEKQTTVLVERLEALVVAGRPPESALASLIRRATGSGLLDRTLRRTEGAYALGAPLFRTLAANAREDGLATCAALADDLERARDLGAGSIGVLRERRATLRAAERARSLEAAAQVEGKLMLILVLCYLPALVLLVVIPLFLGLLEGLLG